MIDQDDESFDCPLGCEICKLKQLQKRIETGASEGGSEHDYR